MGRYGILDRLDKPPTLLLIRPFTVVFTTCLCIWIGLELNRSILSVEPPQSGALELLDSWTRMSPQGKTTTVETLNTVLRRYICSVSRKFRETGYSGLVWEGWFRFRANVPYSEAILTITGTLAVVYALRCGLCRYKTATQLPPRFFQKGYQLQGFVVTANDSDNVRFYHYAPWQRILFWKRPSLGKGLSLREETINVRLAGIDAPEMGHFGGTPQPFSKEAKEWLSSFTAGRRATIQVHRLDQYARAVASVYVWRWGGLWSRNVSLAMVQAGYATVYASAGAEYGGIEAELRAAEARAQRRNLGMWAQPKSEYTSPAAYKKQLAMVRASVRSA